MSVLLSSPQFLPVMVRPPGTSPLAAATAVPVASSTGALHSSTLRRFFPTATGLQYQTSEGTVAVVQMPDPRGQVVFMLPDASLDYMATTAATEAGPCTPALTLEEELVVEGEQAAHLWRELEDLRGEVEDVIARRRGVMEKVERLEVGVTEVRSEVEKVRVEVFDLRREWREAMVEMRRDMEEMAKFKAKVEEEGVGTNQADDAKTVSEDSKSEVVEQGEERIGKVQPKKETDVKIKEDDEATVSLDFPSVKPRLVKRR